MNLGITMGKYDTSGQGRYDDEGYPDAQDRSDRRRQGSGDEPLQDTELNLNWYIVALENGCCDVMSVHEGEQQPDRNGKERKVWGPFRSQEGAIARRIGLIRSGKCKPY